MYDLRVLQQMNEEAHRRAVERSENGPPKPVEKTQTVQVYPLAEITRLLITGPPSLAYIVSLFENSELVAAFMGLVSTYLPEREDEIRAADVDRRITIFCEYFEQRYFPIRDTSEMWDDEDALETFVNEIPVDLMGWTYSDYHDFQDFRTGYVLVLALVESPFYEDEGARVAIVTGAGEIVESDATSVIPRDGWSPEFLHERTDNTKFKGVALFADWLHSQTGCMVLDANFEDYSLEAWRPDLVSELAEEWPRVIEIQDEVFNVVAYLEENPRKHFLELLDMLLDIEREEYVIPKEQLPLFE